MKRLMFIAAIGATGLALSGCETDNKAVRGAAIGAAGGAVAGAVIPGVSAVEGAAIGGVGGAVIGALDKDRRWYRDSNGREYWVDKDGYRHYRD